VLRLVSVSEPFFAALIILEGVFNGAGDVRMPLLFSILSMWGVRIFCTWLCVTRLHLGLTAVWGCMVADNLTRFALMAHRYRGERWKRGITIQNTD
jgi:Na+-driven multidrug efflux pump